MQNVAQSWLVYRLTHSELLLGTAWFCGQIAVFALGPLGGLAADRYSRHKVVILTQTLSMVQALLLAALTLSGRVQVWHILSLAGLLGVLNSAVFNAARVIGPGIAGLLVAAVGEGTCFAINGVSFLAVIGCLGAMRLPVFEPKAPVSPWAHMTDGFRYAWHHKSGRRVLVLMPFFADDIFHRGSRGLGFLMGAMGTGAAYLAFALSRYFYFSLTVMPMIG
jgi:MFS family permease